LEVRVDIAAAIEQPKEAMRYANAAIYARYSQEQRDSSLEDQIAVPEEAANALESPTPRLQRAAISEPPLRSKSAPGYGSH